MRHYSLHLFFIAVILLSACGEDDSGPVGIINVDLGPDATITLNVRDALDVVVRQGSTSEIVIVGESGGSISISSSIVNGNLILGLNGNEIDDDLVTVTIPYLDVLTVTDASDVEVPNFILTKPITVSVTDVSDVIMSGSAPELDLSVDASSDFLAFGLTVNDCSINISDVSDAEVTVTNTLTGSLVERSTFTYRSSPPVIQVSVDDTSDLIDGN